MADDESAQSGSDNDLDFFDIPALDALRRHLDNTCSDTVADAEHAEANCKQTAANGSLAHRAVPILELSEQLPVSGPSPGDWSGNGAGPLHDTAQPPPPWSMGSDLNLAMGTSPYHQGTPWMSHPIDLAASGYLAYPPELTEVTSAKRWKMWLSKAVAKAVLELYSEEVKPEGWTLQWLIEHRIGKKPSSADLRSACEKATDLSLVGLRADCSVPGKGLLFTALRHPEPEGSLGFACDGEEAGMSELVSEKQLNFMLGCIHEGQWLGQLCCGRIYKSSTRWESVCRPIMELGFWLRGHVASMQLGHLSVGKVSRFVQFALREKLLGWQDGMLVPFSVSEGFQQQESARLFLPMGLVKGERYVVTWADLRVCLASLVEKEGGCLMIARLKFSFRAHFQAELAETAFGHRSLRSLCSDPQLQDYFRLEGTINDGSMYLLPAAQKLKKPSPACFQAW